ncbi:MAG: hypothetical protein RL150_367 [Candidatus Parcubacteria bacterium]|jgi:ubiquinone biosynthesis protein
MGSIQFIQLIWELYFKKGLPNLEKIQRWGVLAIKIAQVHALRIDFLGPEKTTHLAKLYRGSTPISAEKIAPVLDRFMATHGTEVAHLEREPFAAASVGQVYRMKLRNGDDAVLKVLKQDFKKNFARDVARIKRLFKTFIFFYPKLKSVGNPLGIIEDIETYTLTELDLRNETKGQQTLRDIKDQYKTKLDLEALDFVQIYEDLSSEDVLVSRFIDAPTFDELLSEGKLTYDDLLKLFYVHGFYMFIVGTFHGDVHPGNVLYKDGKLYFVDAAYIGTVSTKLRQGLFSFFTGLANDDFTLSAQALHSMSDVQLSETQYAAFEKKFLELYSDFGGKTVSEKSLTTQMMQTIKLGIMHGMHFEQGIFAIIRSLMYLDGMVLRCKPDAVILHDMRRFIDAYKPLV